MGLISLNTGGMTDEDRQRLHQLLDYAIDNDENYVLMQYANMSLNWQLHFKRYRLHFKIEEDNNPL